MNISLIGYNITNFIISLELVKKGFAVDILYEDISKKTKTNRTIGISKNNKSSNEASLKYVIFGSFASGLMLFGFSLLYGVSGSLYFK